MIPAPPTKSAEAKMRRGQKCRESDPSIGTDDDTGDESSASSKVGITWRSCTRGVFRFVCLRNSSQKGFSGVWMVLRGDYDV